MTLSHYIGLKMINLLVKTYFDSICLATTDYDFAQRQGYQVPGVISMQGSHLIN